MPATGINHLSISALDIDESCRFFETLFGMERIPTYNLASGRNICAADRSSSISSI
jgi:hypothetical protein